MAGEQLYPEGHHPCDPNYSLTASYVSKGLRRRDVARHNPVKYYFIDFEVTSRFDPSIKNPLIMLCFGQDKDLPELRWDHPYSPYPVDIFTLGNVYQKEFIEASTLYSFSFGLV